MLWNPALRARRAPATVAETTPISLPPSRTRLAGRELSMDPSPIAVPERPRGWRLWRRQVGAMLSEAVR